MGVICKYWFEICHVKPYAGLRSPLLGHLNLSLRVNIKIAYAYTGLYRSCRNFVCAVNIMIDQLFSLS